MKNELSTSVVCALLGLIALSVYGSSLSHGFVQWDDDNLVYENPMVGAFSWENVKQAFLSYDPELYIPLTFLSYQFDHAVWDLRPFGFHLMNVLLHVLCSILLFLILKKFGFDQKVALFGALIFAVHPINVEAVSWVSARKDLLMSFFVLLSLNLYIRRCDSQIAAQRFSNRCYGVVAFILACLAKVTAVMLPFVLLLVDWRDEPHPRRGATKEKIPYFLISLLFILIAFFGKTENISQLSLLGTVLMSMKSIALTMFHLVLPFQLSPLYLEEGPITLLRVSFMLSILFVIAAGIVFWRFRPSRTAVLGGLFFTAFLLPSFSNFARMGQIYVTSDRYAYLPQVGLIILLGLAVQRLLTLGYVRTVLGVGGAVLIFFSLLSIVQGGIWKDTETLYRATLDGSPRSISMRYNLATFLHNEKRFVEAEREYERVLVLAPSYAKALNNFGVLRREQGRLDEAIDLFRRTVQSDPTFREAYENLGRAFGERGMYKEGVKAFKKAMELKENFGYNKGKT